MTECKSFHKYKAKRAPKCNCVACFQLWFIKHPGVVAAIDAMLRKVSEETVETVLGKKYLKHYLRFKNMEDYG
jgi:hypothetical protein